MDRKTLKILDGLKELQRQVLPDATFAATVIEVDSVARTCDVKTGEGIDIYEVRLQAASGNSVGFVIFPTVGSVVLVSVTESGNWYVSAFTGVDKVSLKNNQEDLKSWLDDLVDAIKQITVPTAVGPSGTPINATAIEAIKQRLNNLLT